MDNKVLAKMLEKAEHYTIREEALENFYKKYRHLMNDELLAAITEEMQSERDAYMRTMQQAKEYIENGDEIRRREYV